PILKEQNFFWVVVCNCNMSPTKHIRSVVGGWRWNRLRNYQAAVPIHQSNMCTSAPGCRGDECAGRGTAVTGTLPATNRGCINAGNLTLWCLQRLNAVHSDGRLDCRSGYGWYKFQSSNFMRVGGCGRDDSQCWSLNCRH